MKKDFYITIITLTKNDNLGFFRTFKSIINQRINKNVEVLILDGSNQDKFEKNKNILQNFSIKNYSNKKKLIF